MITAASRANNQILQTSALNKTPFQISTLYKTLHLVIKAHIAFISEIAPVCQLQCHSQIVFAPV